MAPEPVLVVDSDAFVLGVLSHAGRARGLDVVAVQSLEEAEAVLASRSFGVVVVNLQVGARSGLELIEPLRRADSTTETIVISDDRRPSSALASYEHDVFTFIPKPFDPPQLFAVVDRALERRRGVVERRRLNWELQLLNDVATTVAATTDIGGALQEGVARVADAYGAEWAYLRLTPLDGGPPEVRAAVGGAVETVQAAFRVPGGDWPPAGDLGSVQVHSVISVPVVTGQDALGALTLKSTRADRFSEDDRRVLVAVGRQFGVAVANAQLYERVHRAKVHWELTFDAISDPIALFDSDSRTIRTNAAMAALGGWDIRETQGRTCAEVGLCGTGCPECLVGRAIRDGRRLDQEVTTADGRIFSVTTLPVPVSSGAAVLFAKEMTEERRRARQLRTLSQEVSATNAELVAAVERLRATQAQLIQAEKLSAIGQLVAGVAHELNNPLTSVIGFTQLVIEALTGPDAAPPAGVTDDLTRILSESERAARIVNNLLTFSRSQASERSDHDVADLCSRVAALRAYDSRLHGIDVSIAVADDVPPIQVDGGQLQQALLNLVLNAEQAMKQSEVKRLELRAELDAECGAVVIAVSDSGHGIEAAHLARVFDPFFTTRSVGEGTGLGLSIVYGIVRDHGGHVWVTSTLDVGTTFYVQLPVRLARAGGRMPPVALVAHGDSVSRDYIAAVLRGWGLSVRLARNAREALEGIEEADLDVALIDGRLVDVDLQHWREAWQRVSHLVQMVGVVTDTVEDDTRRFLRDAAGAVVSPPHDLRTLRKALAATLGETL